MSPFRSKAQAKYMFSQHPDIAKKWVRETGMPSNLPEHAKKGKFKKKKSRDIMPEHPSHRND